MILLSSGHTARPGFIVNNDSGSRSTINVRHTRDVRLADDLYLNVVVGLGLALLRVLGHCSFVVQLVVGSTVVFTLSASNLKLSHARPTSTRFERQIRLLPKK